MKALDCVAFGVLLAVIGIAPQAAALDGMRASLHAANPAVHKIADKRCADRQGGRHCRSAEPRRPPGPKQSGYGYAYGAPRAEFYPMGSAEWWQAMEREGRTGQPHE